MGTWSLWVNTVVILVPVAPHDEQSLLYTPLPYLSNPKRPCAQIAYTVSLKQPLYGTLEPKHILFRYMDT